MGDATRHQKKVCYIFIRERAGKTRKRAPAETGRASTDTRAHTAHRRPLGRSREDSDRPQGQHGQDRPTRRRTRTKALHQSASRQRSGGRVSLHHPAHPSCRHSFYKLTCEEFGELVRRAGDACELCRIPRVDAPRAKLYIDHDHNIGIWAVRGLLCPSCNVSMADHPNVGVVGFKQRPHVRTYLANPFRLEKPEKVGQRNRSGYKTIQQVRGDHGRGRVSARTT